MTSLRTRLLLIYLLPTCLLLAGGGLAAYLSARRGAVDDLGTRLNAIAQATSGILSSGADAGRLARLEPGMDRVQANLLRKLTQLREATGVRRIFVVDPALRAKVDTRAGTPFDATLPEVQQDRREIGAALAGRPTASVLFTGADGVRYLTGYAAIRLPDDGAVIGVVGVEGSSSSFASLDQLTRNYGLAGGVLLLLLFGLSLWVSARISRPVRRLAAAAQRIGGGDLESEVASLPGSDEIAQLARAIEEMRRAIHHREQDLQLMLSGIAHEVRNPLGGMELFTGLLAEEVADRARPAGYVQRLQRELDHLGRVVNEFLDFARRTPLQRTRFCLEPLLADVVAVSGADPLAAGCHFEVRVVPPELQAEADRRRLRQALLNLARNACQAMPQGGRVLLEAAGQGAELRLTVEDEGPGIPPELREQVFRPFFTTREQGTGLGLALCRKIIADHGGRIELGEGPGGRGARVTMTLPAPGSAAAALADPRPPGELASPQLGFVRAGAGAPASGRGGPEPQPAAQGLATAEEGLIGGDEPLIGDGVGGGGGGRPCGAPELAGDPTHAILGRGVAQGERDEGDGDDAEGGSDRSRSGADGAARKR